MLPAGNTGSAKAELDSSSPGVSWVPSLKEYLGHRVTSRKHSSKTKGPTSWKGAVAMQLFLP